MRAAVLTAPGRLELQEMPVPAPSSGEALVRVHECGICGSDLKMWSGAHPVLRPPLRLGHEFHATVERAAPDVADDERAVPGQAVAIFPPFGCDACPQCRRGSPHLCERVGFVGGQRPGGLAEYVAVPVDNLVAMDPAVPERQRVLLEPLAVGVHAAVRAAVAEGETCVIVGAGPIGVLVGLAVRARGAGRILMADLSEERRAFAERLVGAESIDPAAGDLTTRVHAALGPDGADVAFDCVGGVATAAAACDATRRGGRAVLVGNQPRELALDGIALQRGERSLVGVQMSTRADFLQAMAMLAGGAIAEDLEGLTRAYPLAAAPEAFAAVAGGRVGALKAVVAIEPPPSGR